MWLGAWIRRNLFLVWDDGNYSMPLRESIKLPRLLLRLEDLRLALHLFVLFQVLDDDLR